MESNGLSGGMFSNMGSGMLGLEMSLQHHIPQQNPQHLQQQPHHPMVGSSHFEAAEHHHPHPTLNQQPSVKQSYPSYPPKSKNQQLTLSDEDDPGVTAENSADEGKRKMCPWQRMKWTDGMVKLLIMVVYYIGDEVGSEGIDPSGKKKTGGVLQKKGKWKSVSRAMMERGFYVSPQQCEDKFNDLNKRYKRVNDILGKGTSCRVVENQSLLEKMDHLSPKMKEEVKKLLNSKHLFFREMCAYHNSCNHGSGASGGGAAGGSAHQSPEIATEPSRTQQQAQQQKCLHSSENASVVPGSGRDGTERLKLTRGSGEEEEDSEDDVDEDGEEDEDDEEDEDEVEGSARSHEQGHQEVEDEADGKSSRKRQRKGMFVSPSNQKLSAELTSMVQDGTKSPVEKRQWMRIQLLQLEEQRVGYEWQAFELEKKRLKWRKFSSKKEREMEREKLTNEQTRLENERMVLVLRQKELELIDFQQQSSNKE